MTIPLNPQLPAGLAVEVYRNLHRDCFSVRDRSTRRVIAHVNQIDLHDVSFHVSERQRQRVLAERRKNVHAVVRGVVSDEMVVAFSKVRYNPYEAGFFQWADGSPIAHCGGARLADGMIFVKD